MTSDAPQSLASPESPASPASPNSPASPASPASPVSPSEPEVGEGTVEDQPVEPVDTEQLERSRQAIAEGHEAADKALDPPPDEQDLDFANVASNDDPDAADNAVPRPN